MQRASLDMVSVPRGGLAARSRELRVVWRVALALAVIASFTVVSSTVTFAQEPLEAAYQKVLEGWRKEIGDDKTKFDDAMTKAEEAWTGLKTIQFKIKLSDKEDERAKLQKELRAAEPGALKAFKLALIKAPADNEENRDALNDLRYRICYTTYQNAQYEEAAALGEYLGRKYPEASFGLQCAQIATASYQQLYNKASADKNQALQGDFLAKLINVTSYVANRWKDRPEGQEAMGRLAKYALAVGDEQQAKNILKQLPADSLEHHELNLRMAQGLWYRYVTAPQKPENERPPKDELARMRREAKDAFRKSTEWMRSRLAGQPSYALLSGEVALLQIHNEAGDYEESKKLLEAAKGGLLEQARLNLRELSQGPVPLRPEIYKQALNTYMALKDFDNAEVIITAMAAAGGDTSKVDMAGWISSVAKQQASEVIALQKNGATPEAIKGKIDTLTSLLERMVKTGGPPTFDKLSWPAETLFAIAEGLDDGSATTPPVAKDCYKRASDLYLEIIKQATAKPDFTTPANLKGIRAHLAISARRLNNFKTALDQMIELLHENPQQLQLQIQAAYTYKDFGEQNRKPEILTLAIRGGEPRKPKDGKGPEANVIWGFSELANKTANKTQFRTEYVTARYELAHCRFLQAGMVDLKERPDLLKQAKTDIRNTFFLTRDLGGPDWRARFDNLLRGVQTMLKEPAIGLEEFEKPSTPAKKA